MFGTILAWGGFSTGNFLNLLEGMGFFQYVLPIMLIFAVVFAILTKIHVFADNKGAAVITAFAIALLSIQLDVVPAFFQQIFPNFGVGLSILLVGLILAGAFISEEESYKWVFFGIGALIFIIVTLVSLSNFNFGGWGFSWWDEWGGMFILFLVIVGVVVAVILGSKGSDPKPKKAGP